LIAPFSFSTARGAPQNSTPSLHDALPIWDGNERVRIQAVQSTQAIRRVAPVGARMPLFVGASSKVLLAYAEPEVREAVLNDPAWPASLDREAFVRQLEEIAKAEIGRASGRDSA